MSCAVSAALPWVAVTVYVPGSEAAHALASQLPEPLIVRFAWPGPLTVSGLVTVSWPPVIQSPPLARQKTAETL